MLSMIAAVGQNLELGKNNDLIWHLPDDMKFFRTTTKEHTIIMGRKTFESLGGLLPKRHHVVLTSNKDFSYSGANASTDSSVATFNTVEVLHSLEAVLEKYGQNNPNECFVIGGGEIYKLFLPYAQKMYLTEVDAACPDAQVFFPRFDKLAWAANPLQRICNDNVSATVVEYTRK